MSRWKISIIPEEGWFGEPKFSTRSKKHSTLCRFLPLYIFNIRDVCMDFEPCFKVYNLVSVHPKSITLGR